MMEGLQFAREAGIPLTAHLVIHWGGTMAGDDPEGKVFAHFRELFNKRLQRLGVPDGLVAIWVRECHRNKHTSDLSEIEHAHMLFHLPAKFQRRPYRDEIETVIGELVDFVGRGDMHDLTTKLTFPRIPDGKYFLKGASQRIWDMYRIPSKWRSHRGEGLIQAKRCGTTQNIGRTARARHEAATESKS